MHNRPGHGPTRPDKTRERARQERASPGATTSGGAEDAVDTPKSDADPTLSEAGADLTTSNNGASRRGDTRSDEVS